MNPRRNRRLVLAATIYILIALPCFLLARNLRQAYLDRALIAAIKATNASEVGRLLASGANPDTRDTPKRRLSIVQILKDAIRPLPPDKSPTALIVALQQSEQGETVVTNTIVQSLLSRGAAVNARDAMGNVALYYAINRRQTEIVNAIIAANADVNVKCQQGWTPLILDSLGGGLFTRSLISAGADVNAKDDLNKMTPLMNCAMIGEDDSAKVLISAGADVNAKDTDGNTALYFAIHSRRSRKTNVVAILKAAGAKE